MRLLIALLVMLPLAARAQDVSAVNQALSEKLVAEINENVQLRALLAEARKQLAEAQAKLPKDEKAK